MKLEKTVSLLLTIVIFVTTLTCHVSATTNLEDSSIYFKQTSGSKYCTLDSVAMMFRRKAILDGNDNWVFINEKSMIAQEGNWGSSGLAGEPKYKDLVQGLNMKATGKLLYRLKNNNYKKNSNTLAIINKLKSELDSHKEGIVLYLYNEKYDEVKEKNKILWQHAVILTSYIGDVFYCADPATNKGIINLLNSTLVGENKANTNYVDELLSYSVKIWYISSSSNSSTRSSSPVEIEEKPTKVNASDDNEYDVNNKKKTCWWHVSYDSKGYCKSCGTEYDMNIKNMSATTYQAVKNDVPVRNRPYSPEKITKYLSKGTKVTVVASGKNSARNLWYKLDDGSWIYSKNLEEVKEVVCKHKYNDRGYCKNCNVEYSISTSSLKGTYQAVKDDVPVRNRPYAPEKITKWLSKGTKVNVIASGKNSEGNLWYKLDNGSWIYSKNLEKAKTDTETLTPPTKKIVPTFEIESIPKGNLPYGKDFTLKGWFRSDSAIAETRAYILDENKNVVMQSDAASSTTSNYKIEGYKLDKGIKFDQLSPGGYYLKYYVKDADGDTSTWVSDKFYIAKDTPAEVKPVTPTTQSTSIRFEIESMPKGNLPYGKSFSLKGWFRSDSPIVEARAYMLDANKNIVMQSDPASSTTSNYKIQGYKLDKAMKFNQLNPGGYYLKFFVRDADGDTFTWISDKFYIVK